MVDSTNIPEIAQPALSIESSNFETRQVQLVDNDILRIKPSIGILVFSDLFVVLGLVLAGFWMAATFTAFEGPGSIPLLLIGVLFAATGLWTYHGSNEQIIISPAAGAAFIRSWHPSVPLDTTSLFKHIEPTDITAIQTISRVVKHRTNRSQRSSSYTEYQVNLCTSDNERHNVFHSLKSKRADELGNQLANMFGVPLNAQ